MNEAHNSSSLNILRANPEKNNWDELAFENQIKHELSLEEKKELMSYFKKCGGRTEFDGYKIFVTEVGDDFEKTFTPEQILLGIPNVCYLGNACWNGFDPNDDFVPKDELKDINYQDTPIAFSDKTFTHLRFFGNHEVKTDREISDEIYCRFYLCPELDSIPGILPKLIEKYREKDLRLTAKFSNTNQRNDRMIIYCDRESAISQLEAFQELKEENPELFQNLGKNRLWGEIEGIDGIYFGQENPYSKGSSYSEDRAMVVGLSALTLDLVAERNIEINDEITEAIFDLATLSRRVDTNSWGEYIKGEEEKQMASQAGDILSAIQDPEELEYISEEVDFSKFPNIFDIIKP